eukprot:5072225-Pleurochrysis_carterae.AAC.2
MRQNVREDLPLHTDRHKFAELSTQLRSQCIQTSEIPGNHNEQLQLGSNMQIELDDLIQNVQHHE